MKRRTYLSLVGAGTALSGGIALAKSRNSSEGENERIVYEHEDLRLQTLQDSVRLGETIEFEVANTSDSKISLGCKNPWIVQRNSDGGWQDVTRTPPNYHQLCLFQLPPGESRIEEATMSKDELEEQTGDLIEELRPGRYRFVLLGTTPRLAVDFQITSSR